MTKTETPPLERKLVAIMAADVVGYSRLMHDDEERTLATLTAHRAIIDELIANGRGEIAGTAGDSVLAEFASVVDAVRTAVAIQQALAKANEPLPEESRMLFRIGINVGDVMVKDGDIFGDGVNVAARLEGIAEPGGICVTRGVRDHLRDRMEYKFEDLGEHSVKNIARPVRVFRVSFDPERNDGIGGQRTAAAQRRGHVGKRRRQHGEDTEPVELAFWQSVEASDDPKEYQAYLEQFPEGAFAALAEGAARRLCRRVAIGRSHGRARVLEFDQGHGRPGKFRGLSEEISRRRVQEPGRDQAQGAAASGRRRSG